MHHRRSPGRGKSGHTLLLNLYPDPSFAPSRKAHKKGTTHNLRRHWSAVSHSLRSGHKTLLGGGSIVATNPKMPLHPPPQTHKLEFFTSDPPYPQVAPSNLFFQPRLKHTVDIFCARPRSAPGLPRKTAFLPALGISTKGAHSIRRAGTQYNKQSDKTTFPSHCNCRRESCESLVHCGYDHDADLR